MLLKIFLVFLSSSLLDIFYVFWFTSVTEQRLVRASSASVLIGVCGMFGTLNVVDNHYMAIPYLAGLAFGTAVGMYAKKKLSIS